MSSMQFVSGLPFCELLKTQPSEHKEGWLQWGYTSDEGEWQPIYGLEKSHSNYEAFYLMDAAGVCEAVGQSDGAVVQDLPDPSIPALAVSVDEQPVQLPSASGAGSAPPVAPFLLVGLVCIGGVVFLLRKKRHQKQLDGATNPWAHSVSSRSIHFKASDGGDSGEG